MKLLITDLDNTLYNWTDFYIPSFLAMVHEISRISGISEEELKAAFKRVHEKHGTTEYSFGIEELGVLPEHKRGAKPAEILRKYESAVTAFRQKRRELLRLYPLVRETLAVIRSEGIRIVAHSDSMSYHAVMRLKQLGMEELFDGICAQKDHGVPAGVDYRAIRSQRDSSFYETSIKIQCEYDNGLRKPDVMAVRKILEEFAVLPSEAVYVGDSLTRDIVMAQRSGVWDVYAAYGSQCDPANYGELLKITYWTSKEVEEELSLRERQVRPTFTIRAFPELLSVLRRIESLAGAEA